MKTEIRLANLLSSALEGIEVKQPSSPADNGTDFMVRPPGGKWIAIQAKWAGEGWPDDVRRAAAPFADEWPSNLVLLARQLSPGSIEWLRERGANWADEAGQARIVGPDGLMIVREPKVQAPQRSLSFNWSPSALGLAEALLARPQAELRIARLAELSGWSTPQVASVLQAFDRQGWTAKAGSSRGRGAHRELVDPDGLLAAFSAGVADSTRKTRLAHRATRDVMGLLRETLSRRLSENLSWALTGWAGLELLAPFTTTVPGLHVYIAAEDFAAPLSTAIEESGLREVSEGARVTFWQCDPRILRLAAQKDSVPVVSPPRLYADLSALGARGQDAADHVKQQLIDPLRESATDEDDG